MAVTLNSRRRAIHHNGRIWGYDGNPVALEDGELRLIHQGLWQVIEGLDSVDRKGGSQTAVADIDTGGTIFIHPTGFPTAVLLLES